MSFVLWNFKISKTENVEFLLIENKNFENKKSRIIRTKNWINIEIKTSKRECKKLPFSKHAMIKPPKINYQKIIFKCNF